MSPLNIPIGILLAGCGIINDLVSAAAAESGTEKGEREMKANIYAIKLLSLLIFDPETYWIVERSIEWYLVHYQKDIGEFIVRQ